MSYRTVTSKSAYKLVKGPFTNSFKIPANWEYLKFSDVVLVNAPTKITSSISPYVPMDAVNIEKGSIDYFEERNFESVGSLPKFQENDVLFARITPSTENGKVCIVKNFGRKGIASSELIILRPTHRVIPDYLYFFVKTPRIRKYAISQMKGTTGRQRVPDRVFKNDLYFELPPVDEQKSIVQILSRIHNLIQKTDQIIEQTQRLKKGLMQKLLTKGIKQKRYKSVRFGPLFLDYNIPDNWQVLTLEQCIRNDMPITYGIVQAGPHIPNGIPYIRTGDMSGDSLSRNGMLRTSREIASSYRRSQVEAGEIVCALRGIVGKVLEVPAELEGANLTQGTARISPRHNIHRRYLLWALQSEYARKQFVVLSKGTTLNEITLEKLRTIRVAIPSDINEQKEISLILDKLQLAGNLQQAYKQQVLRLKTGLMQNLLTGKIRAKL